MTEPVDALDATFLELEQSNHAMHMHIGAVMVFEALPGGGSPGLDGLCEHLEPRLRMLPRFRQRLSSPRTGGLSWPNWEQDPHFDLDRHIRRASLSAPGGMDELLEWGSEFWSRRLDRDRPLWEMVLLEGLEEGRWAIVTKTHHAIADGVGAVDVVGVLLDPSPDAAPPELPSSPSPGQSDGLLASLQGSSLLAAARGLTGPMVAAVRAGIDVATNPSQLRDYMDRARAVVDHVMTDQLPAAPRTSLSVPIGPRRRLALIEASLDEIKQTKRELGGTVNDVVLTAVAGGLMRLFEHRGEEPPAEGVRAMVPVNVRTAADEAGQGNKISTMFVVLPLAERDPIRRYRQIVEETETKKAGKQSLGIATLMDVTALAPPALHSVLARAMYSTRLFNLGVTNVPGPPVTLYAFGVPLHQICGFVPLGSNHPVNVGVLSYAGKVSITLTADDTHVPDLEVMRQGIADSLQEFAELAAAHAADAGDGVPEPPVEESVGFRAMTAYLDHNAVDYRVVAHDTSARPEDDDEAHAAAAIARAVLLRDDDAYRVAVLPAAERLDVAKAREALGAGALREPGADELRREFGGYERGAPPPAGMTLPAPEVVDRRLLECELIACVADDRRHSILLDPQRLVGLAESQVADICA